MSRLNVALLAAAAVQLALLLLVRLSSGEEDAAHGSFRLFPLDPASVASIEVESPETNDRVRLVLRDGTWVESETGFPANTPQIVDLAPEGHASEHHGRGILDRLPEVRVRRPVLRNPENHAAIQVADDDYERRVVLRDAAGAVLADFYLSRGSNARSSYVRRRGEDAVYETDQISRWSFGATPADWVRVTYVGLDPADLASFLLRREDLTLELRRDGEAWRLLRPEEAPADPGETAFLLTQAARVTLASIRGQDRPEGFDPVAAEVRMTTADGAVHTLLIGQESEPGQRHAKYSGSDYYVTVASPAIQRLLEVGASDIRD